MDNLRFGQFDQVKIITTQNVRYLSAPPGSKVSPKGNWQVSAIINEELLLVKDGATIKIPFRDVLKISEHNISSMTANFGRLSQHGEEGSVEEQTAIS